MSHAAYSRREFLKVSATASGSLLIGFSLAGCATSRPVGYKKSEESWTANAWLELKGDNSTIFTLDRVEMGQGTYTGLTTLIAEELDLAPERIQVVFAPVGDPYRNPFYKLQLTGGSSSLASSWGQLRESAAATRYLLVSAAASVWSLPRAQLRTENGRVYHPDGKQSLAYSQLVELAAKQHLPGDIPLKSPADYRYIGKHNQRLDIAGKVNGTARYGIDTELPDMLYAVITRPPRYGGKLADFDATAARQQAGVVDIFAMSRGVAVVASSYWQARKAQKLLAIRWDFADALSLSTEDIFTQYLAAADEDAGVVEREVGDLDAALEQADAVITAEYRQPLLAHATLEPQNATAHYQDGRLDVWAPTQAPDLGRIAAARVTDLSPDDITIHNTFIGGGFGRRLTQDFIGEVAEIAYHLRRPVKLIWSREEDTQHDWYRPANLHRLRAAVHNGKVTGWDHQIVAPEILDWYVRDAAPAQFSWAPRFLYDTLGKVGRATEGWPGSPVDTSAYEGAVEYPYAVANLQVRHTHVDPGVPISWWRSVGFSHNGFAVETFMDEIAHALQQDPVAFRAGLLADQPRHLAVLLAAAETAGWGKPLPKGHALGVAMVESFHTHVAQVAQVSIENGQIRVHRVVCAVDCGRIVNPDLVRMQMESGIIFALTAALYGEIHLDQGAVRESNFHDYPLLRMPETPQIDIVLLDNEQTPTGVGEPGVPPLFPALGNALFALTGQRQRSLPLKV